MADQPTERLAATRVPIHPLIAMRWSPRAFDPHAELAGEQVIGLLEAGRWAATWGRREPVRFIVGMRSGQRPDETFTAITELLNRGNNYAKAAGALILVCADEGEDEKTALYSGVDAGAAAANIAIEAVARGLVSHPMAGFDVAGARASFGIPASVRPLMVIAVGTLADYTTVDEQVAERDRLPRERLPLGQLAFSRAWDHPWEGLTR